jgi:hypothetical protein
LKINYDYSYISKVEELTEKEIESQSLNPYIMFKFSIRSDDGCYAKCCDNSIPLYLQHKQITSQQQFYRFFPTQLWSNVNNFIRNLKHLPVWINTELSLSVFGGKQNYEYWQTIFETARSPQGQQVLVAPINLMDMIKE